MIITIISAETGQDDISPCAHAVAPISFIYRPEREKQVQIKGISEFKQKSGPDLQSKIWIHEVRWILSKYLKVTRRIAKWSKAKTSND